MKDVLTVDLLRETMQTMKNAPMRPPTRYGPKWAVDHVRLHEYRYDCAECQRAWKSIY